MGRRKCKHFLPYDEAKSYVRRNAPQVRTRVQYIKWYDETQPLFLPKWPHRVWGREERGFTWNDFLETDNSFEKTLARVKKEKLIDKYRDMWEAVRWSQQFGRDHEITSEKQWLKFYMANKELFPEDIPKRPNVTYPNFPGWPVWLGKDVKAQLETQKNVVAVIALHHIKEAPPNVVNTKIWKDGYSSMITLLPKDQILGKTYQVWHYEPELFQQVNATMKRNGTQQEGNWVIPNVHQLVWDLSEVLLIYDPKVR